jgi:uncharacterized membrane protein
MNREEFQANLTLGERLSGKMASFGGSWPFVILFALIVSL